ncbi:ATP-binding protein [Vibrio vulnificus]
MSFRILGVSIDGMKYKLSYPTRHKENFITVMTGKNGSGKSRILEFISRNFVVNDDFLRYYPERWDDGLLESNKLAGSYHANSMHYNSSGINVYSEIIHKDLAMAFDIVHFVENRYDLFPSKLICLSTSPFDRFPSNKRSLKWMSSNQDIEVKNSIYTYIGLKNSSSISVKSMITNVIDTILKSPVKIKNNVGVIRDTLSYLGYGKRIRLTFKTAIQSGYLLHDDMENVMSKVESMNEMLSSRDLREISDSIRILRDKHNSKTEQFSVSMNLVADELFNDDYISSIRVLLNNDMIKILSFKLSLKEDNRRFITFHNASSGEQCLALMMLGIASVIEDNALICIDEPEISLHPEWQEEFIPMIRESFSLYSGCHFIVATHSPLIVSKLDSDNCIVLDLDKNVLIDDFNTNEVSSDYQLATIFKSPGFKNQYLINECLDVLSQLSLNIDNNVNLARRADKLIEIEDVLDKDDPVLSLISIIKKVVRV